MIRVMTWLFICIGTGILGVFSAGLSGFISRVENEQVCLSCEYNKQCFGRRRFGKNSNILSEFMMVTYFVLRKKCKQIHTMSVNSVILYCIANTVLISIPFWSKGWNITSVLFSISAAMLLALSVVDWNTQYIPVEYTCIIFLCGLIHIFADNSNWLQYLIGLIAVSGFLCIVNWIATPVLKKMYGADEIYSVIGDGDIKLMAATGLLLGWKLNFIALGIGCIAGSVIHLILMKVKGSGRQFAFGPYLSLGVYITMICGEQLVSWYLNILGVNTLL